MRPALRGPPNRRLQARAQQWPGSVPRSAPSVRASAAIGSMRTTVGGTCENDVSLHNRSVHGARIGRAMMIGCGETNAITEGGIPIRNAFRMKVHPGHEAEYEHRHRPIWVALEDALRSHGVSRDSIFLDAATRDLPPSNTPSGRTRHIGSSRPASLGLGTVSQRCRGRQGSSGECAGRSADCLHDSALVGSQLAGDATPARRAREAARTLVAAASRRERTDSRTKRHPKCLGELAIRHAHHPEALGWRAGPDRR